MKIALIVGHSLQAKGAHSKWLGYEYDWNIDLAVKSGLTYETRNMGGLELAHKKLELFDATIELHFNSANGIANGTETLYATENSMEFANKVHQAIIRVLGLKNRGVKKLRPDDRGYKNLTLVTKPCVIIEPGFGDNQIDCLVLADKKDALAQALHSLST
jgi:N-acetylmuramoyl-L-alanine amidase